ncbi:endonuclease [Paraburkholderia sp. Ac-20342]|uniref:YqaJ viral recombinase family protein n=1 Tax=Paraburkholderia sp. Ac-20342 TaxID=2703889 RepID=UPI00197FA137|nr:YqaJ viral recombinase family protein [Paraburkholderia sp. Ac-20342]MBN3848673.1 endonuclease [Paraburkholderia sp. Ac-20342]
MTDRITHDLRQGSDAWIEFRLAHHGASEAAAMLGISPKVKRNELLHMKHTGTPKEFSDWVQEHILDKGHECEALARPFIEASLGEDLYPVTMSIGDISASCDGLTMDEHTAWEHKQWNSGLAASLERGELPEEFMPQAQQVLMVTGAERLIFTCSDGTDENMVSLEIKPNQAWFDNIVDGWSQFRKDLAAYVPAIIPEKPIASPQESLPVPFAQVSGNIAVKSNLDLFGTALKAFIEQIPEKPETDQDFADTDAACKKLKDAEECLAAAEHTALASISDVEAMRRMVADLRELARQTRLAKEKLVENRKKQIKENAVAERRQKYVDHVAALNAELGDVSIVVAAPDFVGAIKGLKTIASLYDKLDTALANGKIAADATAKDLRAKLDWYKQHAEHAFLFRDLQTLIQKPAEDFELAVTTRIEQHKQAEEKRKAEEASAQASLLGNNGGSAEAAATPTLTPAAPVADADVTGKATSAPWIASAPLMSSPRVVPRGTPTLRLGQINERLAPVSLTAEGLATLGFKHAATDKNAKLYYESDFEPICAALIRHIQAAFQKQAA